MNEFEKLKINKDILKSIEHQGFTEPTEVQKESIPGILSGHNLIVQSSTGSGKTLAFLAGVGSQIKQEKKVQVLIVTPTRELANQILDEAIKLFKHNGLYTCAVFGGTSIFKQANDLKRADVVVGTPGRLLDQMKRGNLRLENIKYLVLDEADRMCDMGFYNDITKIFNQTPKEKQILLFSATITRDVSKIEKEYIKNAKKIVIDSYVDPSNLLQEYYVVKQHNKISLLVNLLSNHLDKKSIVFSNTRQEVDLIYHNLKENNIEAFRLHGGLEQNKRTNTLAEYHKHDTAVLISTDVSARGIHIDDLEYIYNFDLPRDDNQYIHRIGRTARAGKKGLAITIITSSEVNSFARILREYNFKAKLKPLPNFKLLVITKPIKGPSGNGSGNRSQNRDRRSSLGSGSPRRDRSSSHNRDRDHSSTRQRDLDYGDRIPTSPRRERTSSHNRDRDHTSKEKSSFRNKF